MKQILIIILICALFGPNKLIACSCKTFNSTHEVYKHSENVVIGTIISERYVKLKKSDSLGNDRILLRRYELLIEKVYKGTFTKDTVVIFTGSGGGDCGYRFFVGNKYIIYGMNNTYFLLKTKHVRIKGKNIIWTNICSPTSIYSLEEENKVIEISKRNGS